MSDLSGGPAGGLTGYMTMMGAMGQNIDRNARLGALLKDQPYIQAQQQAQTQAQQFTNANAPTMMQAQLNGSPFQQQQFAQTAQQQAIQNQMAQQNANRQMLLEEETQRRNTEFMRHNVESEKQSARKEDIAARMQDPFDVMGMNPSAGQQQGAETQKPNNLAAAMNDPNVSGEEFLKQMPIPMATQIKAMVEGRQAPPSSFALKTPYWQSMLQAANKYDPSFDQTIWSARTQTRKSFSPGGKDMANLNSMNTLIGHLGSLKTAADALNNSDVQGVNTFINGVQSYLGDPRVNNFNTAKNAVGNELMRTFIGVGAGSEKEIRSWKDSFDTSNSPAKLQGAIQTAADLLESRLQVQNHAYGQGMGKQADVLQMVYPKSRAALEAIKGNAGTAPISPQVQQQAAPEKTVSKSGKPMHKENGQWVYD